MVILSYEKKDESEGVKVTACGTTRDLAKAMLAMAVQLEELAGLPVPKLCSFLLDASEYERKRIEKRVVITPNGMPKEEEAGDG